MKGRETEITREPTTKEPTTAKHGLRSNRPTKPTVHILHPGTKSQRHPMGWIVNSLQAVKNMIILIEISCLATDLKTMKRKN